MFKGLIAGFNAPVDLRLEPVARKSYLQCLRTGLIQQPVQIAAALRWRDLTLFVRIHSARPEREALLPALWLL